MLRNDKAILAAGGAVAASALVIGLDVGLINSLNLSAEEMWQFWPFEKFTDDDKVMFAFMAIAAAIMGGLLAYAIVNKCKSAEDKFSQESSIFTEEGLIEAKDTLKGVLDKITSCGRAVPEEQRSLLGSYDN